MRLCPCLCPCLCRLCVDGAVTLSVSVCVCLCVECFVFLPCLDCYLQRYDSGRERSERTRMRLHMMCMLSHAEGCEMMCESGAVMWVVVWCLQAIRTCERGANETHMLVSRCACVWPLKICRLSTSTCGHTHMHSLHDGVSHIHWPDTKAAVSSTLVHLMTPMRIVSTDTDRCIHTYLSCDQQRQ